MKNYEIRLHLYVDVNSYIEDVEDFAFSVLDYVESEFEYIDEFYIHECSINEDVDDEIKILTTICISSDLTEVELVDVFFGKLRYLNLNEIDDRIAPYDELNFQYYEIKEA